MLQKLNSDFDSTIGTILSKLTNRYEKVIFIADLASYFKLTNRYEKVIFIADLASLFYERLQLLRN